MFRSPEKQKGHHPLSGDGLWLNASLILATSPAYGRQKDADRQQQQAK
jgi:hypothetical protein